MSLFTIPVGIASHLEKIMGDFLWSNSETGSGLYWVINWGGVVQALAEGQPVRHINEALRTKQLWRSPKEDDFFEKNM